MGTRWNSTLALIGTATGDGRRFKSGGVSHRALPLPLNWQQQSSEGHLTSVTIGSIDTLEIMQDRVRGSGELFDDADSADLRELVAHALALAKEGVVKPSVDPGAVQAVEVLAGTDEPLTFEALAEIIDAGGEFPEIEVLFTHYEIAGATLVSTPAFAEVTFELEGASKAAEAGPLSETVAESLVAAVIGSTELPVADRERAWDGDAATRRVFDHFTDDEGRVDVDGVSRAFLWRDPDADPQTQAAFKLPFADIVDGRLQIVPRGVAATAGGRGVGAADIPEADKERVRDRICALYDRVRTKFEDWPDCPFEGEAALRSGGAEAALRSFVAAGPELPAPELFMDPKLEQITALAREEVGGGLVRVFGHLADPNSCHRGFTDQCLTPPQSQTQYALFHRYPLETSEGPITVGRLTSGLGQVGTECGHAACQSLDDHACTDFDFTRTVQHHDKLTTLAWVRVGLDEQIPGAIWFSGIEAPGLGEAEHAVLARRRVSGDWRDLGATRELCEVLALAEAEPGFEVPRVAVGYRDGRQVSLVAAAQVAPRDPETPQPAPEREAAPAVVPGARVRREPGIGSMVAGQPSPVVTADQARRAKAALAKLRLAVLHTTE